MKNDRPYWNMGIEPKFNTPEMKKIQERKLIERIKLLREKAPYFTRLFKEHGVHEDKIKTFEDFRKAAPPFTKADWRAIAEKHDGNIISALDELLPINAYEDLNLMATTSGTTGEPQPYPLTRFDSWDMYGEVVARYCWRAGLRPKDRIAWAFALSMAAAGIMSMMGPYIMGALVIPVGAEAGTERILKNIRYFRTTALAGTPSLVQYLIEKCPDILGCQVSDLGIRTIMAAGEPGAGLPEIRKKIEEAYKARLFDFGAALGVSCHHPEYQGMHQVADDFMILELVDPETKAPLPFEHGQRGEVLMTIIDGGGWSYWVRFSPGDIFEIYTEPCPCGMSGFRYKVVGRTDDMLKVKGVMVYPAAIANIIESFTPRITGRFMIVLDEPPPRVVPPLKIKVERSENIPVEKLRDLAGEIEDSMSSKLKIRPQIIWLGPNELGRTTYKGKVFEKTYEKK